MNTKKRFLLAVFLILFFQLSTSGVVGAAEYPEKPIQVLVGYVAGSTTDVSIRIMAKVASKYLDKPLVVVNMPGAINTVAINELLKSPPDGYTLSFMSTGYQSLTVHQQKISFDPKMLKPILGYAGTRYVLFVKGDSPYAKLEDFIAYGQKNPGAIKWGHSGNGVANHLAGIVFFNRAKIKAVGVPYQGAAEYVQAVEGGHIMAGVTDLSGYKEHLIAGIIKPVVIIANQRLKDFPDIPTSLEKGYKDAEFFNTTYCIAIRRDTPPDRVKKLHDALKKTVEDPECVKMMDAAGQMSGYVSPAAAEEIISQTEKIGVPILKELGLFVR